MAIKQRCFPIDHQAWNIPRATKLRTFHWPPSLSQPKLWARDQDKGLQRCEPRMSPRITFHAPGNAKE